MDNPSDLRAAERQSADSSSCHRRIMKEAFGLAAILRRPHSRVSEDLYKSECMAMPFNVELQARTRAF